MTAARFGRSAICWHAFILLHGRTNNFGKGRDRRMFKGKARMVLAAAGLLMAWPVASSQAAVIGVYDGNVASPGGYTWTYRVSLPAQARVAPGDFLTIYDFGGFTGTHAEPANWTFLSAATGPDPVL